MIYKRLKKRKEISAVFKQGKRAHGSVLTFVYIPADHIRMAVCVGKKYGKSVQRNRIKRLLRAAFSARAQMLIAGCYLLIPRQAEEYSYHAFVRDIEKIAKREHLLAN